MADRLLNLKSISSRGLKNAVKGNEYRREASISYGILIIGFILLSVGAATGMIGHNLQGQFVPICVYISLAVSLNLVVGISGELSLGHAGFMAVGAYASALASRYFLRSPALFPVAILFGGLVAAVVGLLVAIPSFKSRGDYLAIITLGFTLMMQSIIFLLAVLLRQKGR